MAINVSVQYNCGFLSEIILLTLCYNIGEANRLGFQSHTYLVNILTFFPLTGVVDAQKV